MSKDLCCGNCKHFNNEDVGGWGICIGFSKEFGVHCSHIGCLSHKTAEKFVNGWTEITLDNVEEVRKTDVGRLMIAVITHGEPYYMEYREMFSELTDMAKLGGYYYYVLPELKIE